MNLRALAAAIGLSLLAVDPAVAQSDAGPIRFVVGAPAGGAIDPYARLVSEHMSKSLGRPILVENKPGANGNISAQYMLTLPADGGAVWVGTAAMTEINPSVYSKLPWSIDDFLPLIKGVESSPLLVTHPSAPPRTLSEFVAWVKANPGKLSYASWSPGTPSAFLGHQLNERFGLDLNHVPYRGSAPQTTDLIAGHQVLGFAQMQSALQPVRARQLTAIASTGSSRSRLLPDTPTFAELGYPEFTASVWFGLLVRAGTPPEMVARLLDAAKKAHADPELRAKLEAQGFDVSGQSGPELAASIKVQIERWGRIAKATGFKAD
jgi:tripartite-type tricarboxylate transporter receptor subunit TctC